jgi:hypothetical protein
MAEGAAIRYYALLGKGTFTANGVVGNHVGKAG